jgi:6-pyruvoyltetrahydropterin/6-carboxytetrahydropterin synthase
MVMDFGEVKSKINFMFEAWDHSLMLFKEDPFLKIVEAGLEIVPLRLIVVDYNPTAENMAYHIFRLCIEKGLPIKYVEIQETATGWAKCDKPRMFVGEKVKYYNIPEVVNNV